jgi:hypothetical protein
MGHVPLLRMKSNAFPKKSRNDTLIKKEPSIAISEPNDVYTFKLSELYERLK